MSLTGDGAEVERRELGWQQSERTGGETSGILVERAIGDNKPGNLNGFRGIAGSVSEEPMGNRFLACENQCADRVVKTMTPSPDPPALAERTGGKPLAE